MVRRKKRNSLEYDTKSLVRTGAGLGIGIGVVAGVEKATGVSSHTLPALGTVGSMLRPVTIGVMGGHAIRNLRRIEEAERRASNKRRSKRAKGPEQYGYD